MRDRVLLYLAIPLLWLADKIAGGVTERYWNEQERKNQ